MRKEKYYIKYISKEDISPLLFNVNPSELHFQFKAREWANQTKKFQFQDPFVLQHSNKYKFWQILIINSFKNKNYQFQVFSPTPNDKNFGWLRI